MTPQSKSDNLHLAEKIMSQECLLISLRGGFAIRQKNLTHPHSSCQRVFSGELRKLLSHGLLQGQQLGTSPYKHMAAAITCRLNASAENLNGMQLHKRNDERVLSWLEGTGCDPCVMTSIVQGVLFHLVCM